MQPTISNKMQTKFILFAFFLEKVDFEEKYVQFAMVLI